MQHLIDTLVTDFAKDCFPLMQDQFFTPRPAKDPCEPRKSSPLRMSSIGRCQRALSILARPDAPERHPNTGARWLTLTLGTDLGERVASQLAEICRQKRDDPDWRWGLLAAENTHKALLDIPERYHDWCHANDCWNEVAQRPQWTGHSDLLLCCRHTDTQFGIDIKTKAAFGFKSLKKTLKVDQSYQDQNLAYCFTPSAGSGDGIIYPAAGRTNFGWIFVDRDLFNYLPIDNPIDTEAPYWQSKWEELKRRMEATTIAAASGTPVAAPFEPKANGALPWNCNYCDLGPDRGQCFKGQLINKRVPSDRADKWFVDETPDYVLDSEAMNG